MPWDAGRGTVVGCVARPALWLSWWRWWGVYPVVEVREGPIVGLYLVGVMLRGWAKIRVWHTGVADSHFLTTSKSWIPVGTETRHYCLVFRVTSKVDNGCPNPSQFRRRVDNELAGNRDPMWRTIRTNHSPAFSAMMLPIPKAKLIPTNGTLRDLRIRLPRRQHDIALPPPRIHLLRAPTTMMRPRSRQRRQINSRGRRRPRRRRQRQERRAAPTTTTARIPRPPRRRLRRRKPPLPLRNPQRLRLEQPTTTTTAATASPLCRVRRRQRLATATATVQEARIWARSIVGAGLAQEVEPGLSAEGLGGRGAGGQEVGRHCFVAGVVG